MSDDIEDLLSRMKPSGLGSEIRPRVLAAVATELAALPAKTTACVHSAGHHFVCEHCGAVALPPSRARRWAVAAVLTAMSSAAAVLLMIVIADRNGEPGGEAISMNSPTGRQSTANIALPKTQNKHSPRIEIASAARENGDPNAEISMSSRFVSAQRPVGGRILSAAGFELLDGRVAQIVGSSARDQTSAVDIESNDARITNGALLDSILLESGAGGHAASPSPRQSTILPGSRS
jgi:hypothetical protein